MGRLVPRKASSPPNWGSLVVEFKGRVEVEIVSVCPMLSPHLITDSAGRYDTVQSD